MNDNNRRLSNVAAVLPSGMQYQQSFDFEAAKAAPKNREEEPVPSAEPTHVATETSLPPPLLRPDRQIVYPDAITHLDWPDASELNDHDTLTVDRISDNSDGPAHRFVIKRGDTIKAFFSKDKLEAGTVVGISHAKNEVRVQFNGASEGIWFPKGAIYPALEPEAQEPANGNPLSNVIADLNAKHAPEQAFTEADRVPNQAPFTFTEFKEVWKRSADSTLTYCEYREAFERVAASEAELIAELKSTRTAPQLKLLASRFGDWNARSNTKQENSESIHRKMLSFFLLDGTVSFGVGESYTQAVLTKVRAVTEEAWNEHHQKVAQKRAENEQAIADPKTLADFTKFIAAKSEAELTSEQLARWDVLNADLTRERRALNGPSKTVTQFEAEELGGFEFTIKAGYHDKRECPLWIVQLTSRVERTTFMELKTKAQLLNGWYSSFKKTDAGFQFLTEDEATRFTTLLTGDADREDLIERRKERKELSASERLHELANTMLSEADTMLAESEEAKQNTVKRAREQAGKRGNCFLMQAMARTMHSIAEALSTGDATYLDGIRHRTHIATLELVLKDAKWNRIRAIKQLDGEHDYDFRHRKALEEERPITDDDIRHTAYPYPFAYKSTLEDAIRSCGHKKGMKQAAAKMAKRIKKEENFIHFTESYDINQLTDFISRAKSVGYDTTYLDDGVAKYSRLQRAGIVELHTLRAALREFLPHRGITRGDDPVKVAERQLIGMKLEGFFPTPGPVIAQMLEYADIHDGHRVLESSAGKGDIVTAITQAYPAARVMAIEKNHTLSDVLSAKGIDVEFADFLTHAGQYDRIVQNPPFEQGPNSDIDHVRHAYDLLAPGGRLVSVMCEGPFFRSDQKSREFRNWFDELDGVSYELPEDAFKGVQAFRETGVNTRIVVLDRE